MERSLVIGPGDLIASGGWIAIEPIEVASRDALALRTEQTAGGVQESALRCGFGRPRLVRYERRPRERASLEHPNIVFIVMDTLRGDRLSCYGYRKPTSPNRASLIQRS